MNRPDATGAQLRGVGRCALTGILVSLLAVPGFALTPQPASQPATPSLSTAAATLGTDSGSADLPLIAGTGDLPDASVLAGPANPAEAAPDAMSTSSLPDLHKAMKDALDQGQQLTNTQRHHGVQRPGMLALGIVGAVAMGMGAYVYSLNGSTRAKAIIGTMFMAPGAVAAGFGFSYAFKPHNK